MTNFGHKCSRHGSHPSLYLSFKFVSKEGTNKCSLSFLNQLENDAYFCFSQVFSVQGRRFVSSDHESSDDGDSFSVGNLWDNTESSENDDFLRNFDFWDKTENSDDDNSRGEGEFGDFFGEGSFWGDKGSSEDGNFFNGGDFLNEDGDADEDRSFQFGRRFKRSLSNTR